MPQDRRAFSAAKTKPSQRTKCNRSDLSERPAVYYDDADRRQRNPGARPIRRQRSSHAPNGLRHHSNSDEFQPVQESFSNRAANAAAPSAKASRIKADGMVKANHAAKPPKSPLPRSTPSENPTWLDAGPGKN